MSTTSLHRNPRHPRLRRLGAVVVVAVHVSTVAVGVAVAVQHDQVPFLAVLSVMTAAVAVALGARRPRPARSWLAIVATGATLAPAAVTHLLAAALSPAAYGAGTVVLLGVLALLTARWLHGQLHATQTA